MPGDYAYDGWGPDVSWSGKYEKGSAGQGQRIPIRIERNGSRQGGLPTDDGEA